MSELNLQGFFGQGSTAGSVEEESTEESEETTESEAQEKSAEEVRESEEETSEEDSTEPDETEKERRAAQSRADQLSHQNTLLQAQIQSLESAQIQNTQTDNVEDDFAGLPDDELLTVGQQKEIKRKEAQRVRDLQKAQEIANNSKFDQELWLKGQPDYQDVDQHYLDNKDELDQIFQYKGLHGNVKAMFAATEVHSKETEMVELKRKIDSLKKENKKLKKVKGKVPQTGPGGRSETPRSDSLNIHPFFKQNWNR